MVLTIIIGMNYIYFTYLCSKWHSNVVFVCFDTYIWLNENHRFMSSWRVYLGMESYLGNFAHVIPVFNHLFSRKGQIYFSLRI